MWEMGEYKEVKKYKNERNILRGSCGGGLGRERESDRKREREREREREIETGREAENVCRH